MSDAFPLPRFHAGVMIGLSLLIVAANAALSIIMVALAVPGTGKVGTGFSVIAGSFIVGNLLLLGGGLYAARHHLRLVQVLGLLTQLLTIPLCIGVAMLIMLVFGVTNL